MKAKKPYKKPEITEVELRPEEAVLTACQKCTSRFCLTGATASDCFICPLFGS